MKIYLHTSYINHKKNCKEYLFEWIKSILKFLQQIYITETKYFCSLYEIIFRETKVIFRKMSYL